MIGNHETSHMLPPWAPHNPFTPTPRRWGAWNRGADEMWQACRPRLELLQAALAAVWERRATVDERGLGYDVHLDSALCAQIRVALGEPQP